MKTPTHMLIGQLVSRLLPGTEKDKSGWVIAGAAMPDLPLIAVAVFCWMETAASESLDAQTVRFIDLVDSFYYDNSVFIALHHLLHSPSSLALLASAWLIFGRTGRRQDPRGFWFLSGAASHSLVDIFTHARDGILLFWPWNWSFRFNSGIDQWDMVGSGLTLLMVEGSLFVVYGSCLIWSCLVPFYHFLRMPPEA